MSGPTRAFAVAATALVIALLPKTGSAAGIDMPQGDGWYRWQTSSASTAGDACCHEWRNGAAKKCVCKLDGRHNGLTIDTGMVGDDRTISIYVKLENGFVTKIRALKAACPVTTTTRIEDLGTVDPVDSIAWLRIQLTSNPGVAGHAIDAIGVHGGDAGVQALVTVIEDRSFRKPLREQALFWLAQSDSDDAFDYLDRLLSRR